MLAEWAGKGRSSTFTRQFKNNSMSLVKVASRFAAAVPRIAPPAVVRSSARAAPAPAAAARSFSAAADAFGRLDDKVIVVCGAGNPPHEGHGIGAQSSIVLARHGAKVVSVSPLEENCQTVTDAILAEGNHGKAHVADCTDGSSVQKLVDDVMAEYGRIDVVVNAGIHSALPMGFAKMTEEAWEKGIALNLDAHFQIIHKFLPVFVEQQKGNIIHYTTIASSVGLGIGNQRHAYAAGKAAAATLTKRIGVEYAKQGIRGNVIGIGYVDGPLVNRAVAAVNADIDAVTKVRDSYVPRGKQGTPEEVAQVAVFLASDSSSIINGTEIYADGGSHGCTYGP